MRILFIGNSHTYFNDLPGVFRAICRDRGRDVETDSVTKGGYTFAHFLSEKNETGRQVRARLAGPRYDYVVLQEQTVYPITAPHTFRRGAARLCELVRENGAVPVLYATWAYQKDGKQLQKFGIDYDEMYRKMHEAYAEAAEKNHTLLADVGSAFYEKTETENLFNDDGSHPNEAGSNLAAETIAEVILKDANA